MTKIVLEYNHGTELLNGLEFKIVVVVQSLSHVHLFVTSWTTPLQASLFFTISRSLLKLMSIVSVMPSNHLILCRPLLLLPSILPSISLCQWVSSSDQVAKVLELQLQHQSFHKYSGLISFRTDWFPWCSRDTQESSLAPQFKSINSSVLSLLYGLTLPSVHDYWKNHRTQ